MKNLVTIQTPEYVKIPFETAGLVTRGIAKLIDLLCVSVILAILYFFGVLIASFQAMVASEDVLTSMELAIVIVISAAIPLIYFTMTEYWMKGQTIGKRVMRLRVIQDNGQSPSFFAVFLRNVLQLVDMLPFFYLLGMISIFMNKKEKRIGDLVAGTIVVCEKKKQENLFLYHTYPYLLPHEKELYQRLPVISGELYYILESFLLRRDALYPSIRKQLAMQLIQTGWPHIQIHPGQEEVFLEKVYLYLRETSYPAQYPYLIPQYFPIEKHA
ncbi:RDD family protein [Thermoflavimicrobium dichotomicum]|uniref:Uncharacterized membrane protein YckC, RDD family n=1 Tax=Thermoflavimicrobium dichotomicum TaxID=46223 RepID=A0A1I3RXZ0_9BACL|nr:RDD family protein [Thermoflavimicrobium dichotomicum]SFJ50126.1 Uncharacterized membrane protein YckC, RDD family [Thermoflavimicrobium dichotomicum]